MGAGQPHPGSGPEDTVPEAAATVALKVQTRLEVRREDSGQSGARGTVLNPVGGPRDQSCGARPGRGRVTRPGRCRQHHGQQWREARAQEAGACSVVGSVQEKTAGLSRDAGGDGLRTGFTYEVSSPQTPGCRP